MKRSFALVIAALSVIVIYNILFSYGILPSYPPFTLSIGRAAVLILSFLLLACGVVSYFPQSRRYIARPQKSTLKGRDSTKFRRVVRDGVEGPERLVFGSETTTFRDACIASWQFESVSRKSNWFVKDDRGNDITNILLSSFDGIATLFPEYGSEIARESSDQSSEYSDLKDSVEYYD